MFFSLCINVLVNFLFAVNLAMKYLPPVSCVMFNTDAVFVVVVILTIQFFLKIRIKVLSTFIKIT